MKKSKNFFFSFLNIEQFNVVEFRGGRIKNIISNIEEKVGVSCVLSVRYKNSFTLTDLKLEELVASSSSIWFFMFANQQNLIFWSNENKSELPRDKRFLGGIQRKFRAKYSGDEVK